MRILVVSAYIGSTYGGSANVVTQLVQTLGQLAIPVDLITTIANGDQALDVPLNRWCSEPGYRVRYFSCWNRNDLIVSRSMMGWLIQHVADYDLVHTHGLFMPMIAFTHWVCQLRRVPYVMTPHGMLEPWALAYKAGKKKLYYAAFEQPALRRAIAIQVLTPVEAQQVQAFGFGQAVIVPNGIRTQEFASLADPEIFYQQFPHTRGKTLLLFLGRIDPKKGLNLLASAFANVRQPFPNAHLVVAGPDTIDFLPTVQGYFAQAGALEAVTFTGMLTGEIKRAALAAATVYVAPSYSEGFSISVLEGMASGLPCIITSACNFPEAAGVAHVVEIDSEAIAAALLVCLSDTQQAARMGEQARQFVLQHYTWEASATKLLNLYQTMVGKPVQPLQLEATP